MFYDGVVYLLNILKYLHENGLPFDPETFVAAVNNGHVKILDYMLKYLHKNGCPLRELACFNAAGMGNLEMLKYLHENGCPWDGFVCTIANMTNRQEILKYLHENNCPCDKDSCRYCRSQ